MSEIEGLPDESRVWIFGSRRPPTGEEANLLVERMGRFVAGWAAHREQLRAGLDWRHGRFLLIAVDESATAASGCSIDALVGELRELEEELDLSLVDTSPVWFRDPDDGERIRCVRRDEFRELAEEGAVDGRTIVFDLTVGRLGPVRRGQWERPAAESWHRTLLPERTASAGGAGT